MGVGGHASTGAPTIAAVHDGRNMALLCYHAAMEVKTIGASGQISLGKQWAGRTVVVEELEPGVWSIKTAQVIPDNERWLHTPEMKQRLDKAFEWSATHPPQVSDLDAVERKLRTHLKKRAAANK